MKHNPDVGHRFKRKCKEDTAPASESETEGDKTADDLCLMYEMKRKSLGWALLKHEMLAEMSDRNVTKETFGPKLVGGVSRSFKETADSFMTKIDKLRQKELYPHKTCHPACEARGCKSIVAVDGLWKLRNNGCQKSKKKKIEN